VDEYSINRALRGHENSRRLRALEAGFGHSAPSGDLEYPQNQNTFVAYKHGSPIKEILDGVLQQVGIQSPDRREDFAQKIFEAAEKERQDARLSDAALRKRPRWIEASYRNENPQAFISRVYGDLLGQGLTRAHLRQDSKLYEALQNWLRNNRLTIHLPSRFELAAANANQSDARSRS
jgi:hypothetical protein